jgi:hypothetical protein
MFCPTFVKAAHNLKLVDQFIRETFGGDKLSKDTIKYYAKMNYNLPANHKDFLFQLDACYRALELLTHQRGKLPQRDHAAVPTKSCPQTGAGTRPCLPWIRQAWEVP